MKINYKKLSLSIIIIIVLSLVATGIIVWKLASPTEAKAETAWFISESIEKKKPICLDNAYIISNNKGILEFIHNKETYTIEGSLSTSYEGVADILVEQGKISKICMKPYVAEGTLLRYTDVDITLKANVDNQNKENNKDDGDNKDNEIVASVDATNTDIILDVNKITKGTGILIKKTKVPVYQNINGRIIEVEWDSLMLGTSVVKAVMEKGQVSALIIEKEIVPTSINVLLRNGNSVFHKTIYIRKVYENTLINVKEVMEMNEETHISLIDKKGLILCDSNNQPLGQPYVGELQIFQTDQGYVLLNTLEFETYLKYVIPSEMPRTFSHEALKAQAVCARTYAYMQMRNGEYAMYGANLDDTTNYQVYHAFGRYPETDAAVEETKGEVVLYNGELINCYYYSSCAGVTNDFSVWGEDACDYIGMRGLEHLEGRDLTNPKEFSEFIHSDFKSNDSEAPYYRWESELRIDLVNEPEFGKLKSIEVLKRNKAGYIIKLRLIYENKDRILTNECDIREAIGLYLTKTTLSNKEIRTNLSMLPSACFEVEEVSDGIIVLIGGGYGHAIGFSQHGANALANNEKTYDEIIKYYYKNVEIGTLK